MTPLRAFVGHSFTDDNAEVTGKFLKYLDQLAELHPTFSWEHAEPAEPKFLAEKVKRLLAGKNLFIGICTKKERVISPSALSPSQRRRASAARCSRPRSVAASATAIRWNSCRIPRAACCPWTS